MKIATVLWSGGLDSTAALHKTLWHGDYDVVTAHHVKLLTREGADRVQAEMRACRDMWKWFNMRDMGFKLTFSEYESLFDQHAEVADIILLLMPGMHALKNEYHLHKDKATQLDLVYGDHAAEFARLEFSCRWTCINRMFKAFWESIFIQRPEYDKPKHNIIAPNLTWTKEDIYYYLPEELRNATASCRKGGMCGNCRPCLEIEAIRTHNHG